MENDSLLLAGIKDKIKQALDKNMVTNTKFLDARQRSLAEGICKKHREVKSVFYGGYPDAERTVGVFLPDYIEAGSLPELAEYFAENTGENPLTLLRVSKDSFTALSHRDYLGSITGLGVNRDMLGDILVREDGCDIIIIKSIAGYLEENLQKAGRGTLTAEIRPLESLIIEPVKTEEKLYTVASMRLDNIVSAVYAVSRSSAAEAISRGIVFVNSLPVLKPDTKTNPGDKINLRGKGKAVLKEITGETKKGRIKVLADKFI